MTYEKGVSTLVATVLLIAFTVSISMIIMGWFSSFTRSATENVSDVTLNAIGCSSGIIDFDHIYVNNLTNVATINVFNSGQIELTINAMIVNTSGAACRSNTTTQITLLPGSSGSITLSTAQCAIATINDFSRALLTTSCSGVAASTTSPKDVTVR